MAKEIKETPQQREKRRQIVRGAAPYLCDQEDGDLYDAYLKLLEESEKGNGDNQAADFVTVWQPLENSVSVDEMIRLIEDGVEPVVPEVLLKIDWTDLRAQKSVLLAVIDELEKKKDLRFEELDGILNLIDALQDYAVDEMGVPEMMVYDFEEEEKREEETFNERFARESAESIFDFLCESDGFHVEDDMTVEFIAGIMADRYHSDIIKAKIKEQILIDLKENSREFVYDDTQRPQYDADMREDYEGIATAYCREVKNK